MLNSNFRVPFNSVTQDAWLSQALVGHQSWTLNYQGHISSFLNGATKALPTRPEAKGREGRSVQQSVTVVVMSVFLHEASEILCYS